MPASITKETNLVLSTPAGGNSRISKAVTLVLASVANPMHISKSSVLVLSAPDICLTKLCQCWKITRRDGIVFSYTTHNESVNFMGVTYKPCSSLSASAFESGLIGSNGVGDVEVTGILSDDNITEHDLSHGLFDGATVDVYLVSWDRTNMTGTKRIGKGILGDTTQGGVSYTSQVLTIGMKLSQNPLIEVYSPSCRYTVGYGHCPVVISTYQYNGTVTGVLPRTALNRVRNRQFFDSSISQADGYYDTGRLIWTSGSNIGISCDVKNYFSSNDLVSLWESMPNEINIGDQYTITPGCDGSTTSHTVKFGLSMDSFGGQPDLPGNDALMRTPNAK